MGWCKKEKKKRHSGHVYYKDKRPTAIQTSIWFWNAVFQTGFLCHIIHLFKGTCLIIKFFNKPFKKFQSGKKTPEGILRNSKIHVHIFTEGYY